MYEQGYGKDAAAIAAQAISHAADVGMDIVLVDTAGRMQDNEPLMRALTKVSKVTARNDFQKYVFFACEFPNSGGGGEGVAMDACDDLNWSMYISGNLIFLKLNLILVDPCE